jgi:hypothetical protein
MGMFAPWVGSRQVDHKCHNTCCVRPTHLRPATNKQNNENKRGAHRDSRSGIRGVYWNERRNCWYTSMGHNGKLIAAGSFPPEAKAEAEAAIIAKRNEFFTHNDLDRLV